MNHQRIFIIGFMGVGKSTLGKRLANHLGYRFMDTDQWIEKKTGLTVQELFNESGEEVFRNLETEILHETAGMENIVISTGGGLPCHDENMLYINQHGLSVYLEASPELIFDRLRQKVNTRPLLYGMNNEALRGFIEDKLRERAPVYRQALYHVRIPLQSIETLVKSMNL